MIKQYYYIDIMVTLRKVLNNTIQHISIFWFFQLGKFQTFDIIVSGICLLFIIRTIK